LPFGYSKKIFKYPAVQYIPLEMQSSMNKQFSPQGKLDLKIYNSSNENLLNNKIKRINFKTKYKISQNQLAILIINGYVDIVKYRGYEVYIVGYVKPGTVNLFKVTTEYFYKDRILFAFYDGTDEERIEQIFIENI
jgi:hypothetical protein